MHDSPVGVAGSRQERGSQPSFAAMNDDRSYASLERVRVLIVEDEGLVALDIESILRRAGCEVVGVVDTEREAVAAVERLSPEVVLMDIALAQGDGVSAAKAIRRYGLPVIFVSGNSDAATLARATEAGPAGFVHKPFDGPQLIAALRAALRRHG